MALTDKLTAIADAIRAKDGTTDTMTLDQIPEKIAALSSKVAIEWHQCPEAVRNYIANVDYDGVAYTDSSIGTYAPSPAVPTTNTKPIGKSVDGKTFYNETPNVLTPFATTHKAGTLKPLDQVRWINSRTNNMRDLGGWACDGGKVKYGLLYRSGELNAQDEYLLINELGINTECDLTADGTPAYPSKMRFIGHTSYAMYSLTNTEAWRVNLRDIFEAVQYGDPVVFHCSMGADRTGTLACVLEGLLGVSQSDIDKDYELTSFYALRARNGNYQGGTTDWAHLIGQIEALSGDTFRDKCVTFVLSLGFTAAEINAYRSAMINGTPEAIVAQTYSVTNNLTNCTTNNSATQIGINESYTATITANSGYKLDGATVSVKMGGTDITSTTYSNGVISIPTVTGVIVIQIAAAKEKTMKELFDPSAANINQRFSSSGAYSALNGHFCSDYIPVSGLNASEPWRIHIKDKQDATRFRASAANESVVFCKSDKSIMNANYGRLAVNTNASGTSTLCKHNDSSGGVYIDINQTSDGNFIPSTFFDLSQVKYIRVCMAYSVGTAIPDTATLANVSITADKIFDEESDEPINLFDPNDADVLLRGRFNSAGAAVDYADNQLVTGYIAASVGDVFRIETDKALTTNGYTGMVDFYDSGKVHIAQTGNANTQVWSFSNSDMTGVCTIPASRTGTAYVRFCIAYTDISNIKIYKQ